MSITSSFSPFTITTADGISGNVAGQKSVTGLAYVGSVNEYVQQWNIGVAAITSLGVSGSTTGGTLTAGTYYYVVTALNGTGETTVSNEVSVTNTGSTSSNTLAWTAMPGATNYRIYRGTSTGGENHYQTLTSSASGTLSFTDAGATGTSATPPGSNTTGLTWTPTLPLTPLRAVYVRNLSTTNTLTVAWTPTGGSSNTVIILGPLDAIAYCMPSGLTTGGVTAMIMTASANGTPVEGYWTA